MKNDKQEFIVLYLDDYVRMAYRIFINKVDIDLEKQLVSNLYYLMDRYVEGELSKYIDEEKIV